MEKTRILIANRGEIACRIIKTCRRLGYETVAIFTTDDQFSQHVREADVSLRLPDGPLGENYLNVDLMILLAKETGVTAVHPGYGFISENAEAARKFEENGIVWVGPTSQNITDYSTKHISKQRAEECNIPITKTSKLVETVEESLVEAEKLNFPVMIKCSNGGGGIGMFKCETPADIEQYFPIAYQKSDSIFKGSAIFLEKYISKAHHIEVQIVGDGKGNAFALGERECSIQRRNQKVIEESPSPFITHEIRDRICADAVRLAKLMNYKSLGTVEFIMDDETLDYFFLEVNCRLQVEHPVTEMTYDVDLVEVMFQIAFGVDFKTITQREFTQKGHSIEVRVYSENPLNNYAPSSGRISYVHFPTMENIRVDSWIENDSFVSPLYDPLLAKIISFGETRQEAVQTLINCLSEIVIQGISTNLLFLQNILMNEEFDSGRYLTKFLDDFTFVSHSAEVIESGLYALIQDLPGRVGYWHIGISPSGPMDKKNFKIANWLVGNNHNEAGIEILLDCFSLKFHCATYVSVTGADCNILVNDHKKEMYESIYVPCNGELHIKLNSAAGCRAYLAIQGGIQTVPYLGSRSTFASGNFGGLHGQQLRMGDMLPLAKVFAHSNPDRKWPKELRPQLTNEWIIYALGGPYGAPDYLTNDDIVTMWNHTYKVNHNANRLGVRLEGFIPKWTRNDGGDAGLHPSNVHDYAYGVGAVNFSGNIPIILTIDGPSLGGFVCPMSIIESDLWKVGQVRPGDSIRFVEVDYNFAIESLKYENSLFEVKHPQNNLVVPKIEANSINPIFKTLNTNHRIHFRMSGDTYVLVDIHLETFCIENRFVLQHVIEEIKIRKLDYILELVPGVTSLLIKYDNLKTSAYEIADLVTEILHSEEGKNIDDIQIKCRKVKLPLVFRDKWCLEAIERYSRTVRKEAPYLPDNCEFVRQINDLKSLDELAKIISETTYLVLGLGDVYLGAPCAVPYDPRHRIVTTKYNPARTFTPEGAVGIGGIYMCIYGMESPGGYQLVGRSIPIWSTYNNPPWLLDFFDHVSFYLVTDEELLRIRNEYRLNKYTPTISETTISLGEYKKFLCLNKESIEEYQKINNIKTISERIDWSTIKDADHSEVEPENEDVDLTNCYMLKSNVYGNLYEVKIKEGDQVKKGQSLMLIEVMKMSIYVNSPVEGIVVKIMSHTGRIVKPGEELVAIRIS